MRKRGYVKIVKNAIESIDVPVYNLNVSKIDTVSQVGASLYEYIDEILASHVCRNDKIYEVVKPKDSL